MQKSLFAWGLDRYCQGVQLLRGLDSLPLLLIRLTVGAVFIESGWGKLHHLDKVTEFFTSLGLPVPGFQAVFVSNIEFLGGMAIVFGLATRLAAVPLIAIMGVAILTAKKEDLHGFSDLIGFPETLYALLLFALIFFGAGKVSIDALLDRLFVSRKK